jgi:hypothetical protein
VTNQENPNVRPMMTTPVVMNPQNNIPQVMQNPYNQATMPQMMSGAMKYQALYPEVFYKLQPYVMMACDQMDAYGYMMPTQEIIEHMSDNICDDVCKMYPDLAEYAHKNDNTMKADPPNDPDGRMGDHGFMSDNEGFMRDRDRFGFGRGFRRRGFFRDFIDILLLSELFGRRRRRF